MGNIIHFRGSGSFGNNFFKLTYGTKPLSPKESTLWIDTTVPIKNYQFVFEQPTSRANGASLETGDLWIKENNGSFWTSTMVYQYINNAWVYKDAEIYLNGKWNSLIKPQYPNQWLWKKYATITSVPTPANFVGRTPTATEYIQDSATSLTMNKADNYSAYAVTYLLFNNDTTISGTFGTDDGGTLTINDVLVHSNAAYTTSNVTMNFKKGWNKVEVCYTEITGGDGWAVNPKFYNHASVAAMYASIH